MKAKNYEPITLVSVNSAYNNNLISTNPVSRRWDDSALSNRLNGFVRYPSDDKLDNTIDFKVGDSKRISCDLNKMDCEEQKDYSKVKVPNGNTTWETFDNTVCGCYWLKVLVIIFALILLYYIGGIVVKRVLSDEMKERLGITD